jgi:iron complex transport system permease protein
VTDAHAPRWSDRAAFPLALLSLAALVIVALALGKYTIDVSDVLRALTGGGPRGDGADPDAVRTVLWNIRLPRVLGGVLIGAALGAAGAAYQAMFRNPLVSPDILGVSAGAGLGALLAIFFGWPVVAVQAAAFCGGLLAVGLVTMVAGRVRRHDPVLVLVLAGVAVGTLLAAGTSLLKILADPYTQLPAMTYWLLGGLSAITRGDVHAVAPAIVAGIVPLWLLRWRMNLLSLADEEATALGVDVRRLRVVLVAAATLITAAAVSISGTIGWVGLVVPHVARLLVGPDFRRLLPMALVLGAAFLVAADTIARTAASIEIPLGVLTAVTGAPFFLWLLARSRRAW